MIWTAWHGLLHHGIVDLLHAALILPVFEEGV